jgi:hypothetical protein
LYPTGRTGYEQYYIDLSSFWRDLYDPHITSSDENYDDYYHGENNTHWNKNVFEHPELLNFWFDFLDTSGELQ